MKDKTTNIIIDTQDINLGLIKDWLKDRLKENKEIELRIGNDYYSITHKGQIIERYIDD